MIPKETLNNEKQRLRDRMRKLLRLQQPSDFNAHQERIVTREMWKKPSTVLLYWALPGEPDPSVLISGCSYHRFVFPRIEGDKLGLYQYADRSQWVPGPFGLKEPDPETWEQVSPRDIDLAFIPGLTFDPMGARLGRGKGFYDRLLGAPGFHGVKIGLCWEWQIIPSVPRDSRDILMDLIISEEKAIFTGSLTGSGLDKRSERR